MRSSWIGGDPTSNDECPHKRETRRCTQTFFSYLQKRVPGTGRQGTPAATGNRQRHRGAIPESRHGQHCPSDTFGLLVLEL